jgi:hypothetical protein
MFGKRVLALAFGGAIGLSGTLLHNSYRPVGLVLALLALLLGAHLIREMHLSRMSSWLYVAGWFAVIFRASNIGNGGEILIEANLYGNFLVLGGTALVIFYTLRNRNPIN